MFKKVSGERVFLQDEIRDHYVWQNLFFWEEYFWDTAANSLPWTIEANSDAGFSKSQKEHLQKYIITFTTNMLGWGTLPVPAIQLFVENLLNDLKIDDPSFIKKLISQLEKHDQVLQKQRQKLARKVPNLVGESPKQRRESMAVAPKSSSPSSSSTSSSTSSSQNNRGRSESAAVKSTPASSTTSSKSPSSSSQPKKPLPQPILETESEQKNNNKKQPEKQVDEATTTTTTTESTTTPSNQPTVSTGSTTTSEQSTSTTTSQDISSLPILFYVIASADYNANTPTEMSLKKGDTYFILQVEDSGNWYLARNGSYQSGWVPTLYVKKIG
eukprot:TRINITY_DN3990_c0_g1_i1.p1 TRINITY_DN3990_c0_g1~~TRINITY_DN3990_c0_g1_i1.p1  ORF type:complete len:373 (+),score=148.05 TRINITY_DN3990_c0_g1_i1:138-1121(+)